MIKTERWSKAKVFVTQLYAEREGFDFRALALFRIGFGLVLLANLFTRTYGNKLIAHYTENGLLPLAALASEVRWSFLDAFSQPLAAKIGFFLIALVYLAFTVGWGTRIVKPLIVVILVSLYHRNPIIDDGSDWTLRLFALWMQFFPVAERWSVDALYGRKPVSPAVTFRSAAAISFTINLSISYFLNAWQKDSGPWLDGTAVRMVLWDPWTSTGVAVWLRSWVPDLLVAAMTYGTKVLEYLAAAAVVLAFFFRWAKLPVCLLLFVVHAGFGVNIHLGTFVLNYFAVALLFVPAPILDRIESFLPRPLRYTYHPTNSLVWSRAGNVILFLFCLAQTRVLLINNSFFAGPVPRWLSQHSPAWISDVDRMFMVTQEWFMFRYPGSVPLLTLETVMADGRRFDPIRHTEFSAVRPATESQHVGKYWVTYLWRLRGNLGKETKKRLLAYFSGLGAREVNLYSTTVTAPRTAQERVQISPPQLILSLKTPNEWNFRPQDIAEVALPRGLASAQDMRAYEGEWRGDDQLFLDFTQGVTKADLNFSSAVDCLARVKLEATTAPDFGKFKIALNGQDAGVLNAFRPDGVGRVIFPLGSLPIKRGENRLTVVNNEPDPAKKKAGIDLIAWDCEP